MQSGAVTAAFWKADVVSYDLLAPRGQKSLPWSSFLHGLLFASLLAFKEGVPGLHVGPREAAVGQISDDSRQFRDLGKGREVGASGSSVRLPEGSPEAGALQPPSAH